MEAGAGDVRTPWAKLYRVNMPSNPFVISKPVTLIGRSSKCDIIVHDPEWINRKIISRNYCCITRNDFLKTAAIEDISKLGTFVNGKQIEHKIFTELKHGDKLAFGDVTGEEYQFIYMSQGNVYPEPFREKYDVAEEVGKGGFGEVVVVYNKVTNQRCALQNIHSAKNKDSANRRLELEANILKSLDHVHILKFIEHFAHPEEPVLLFEFIQGKDLYRRIEKEKQLSEKVTKLFMYQVSKALSYLHDQLIIHRDIKSLNILLMSEENISLLKVCDFGLAKRLESATSRTSSFCGTPPPYIAPEIFDDKPSYDTKVDVYSLGVTLYVCVTGPNVKTIKKFKFDTGNFAHVSEAGKALNSSMVDNSPNLRPSMEEILGHEWFTDDSMLADYQSLIAPDTKKRKANDDE